MTSGTWSSLSAPLYHSHEIFDRNFGVQVALLVEIHSSAHGWMNEYLLYPEHAGHIWVRLQVCPPQI